MRRDVAIACAAGAVAACGRAPLQCPDLTTAYAGEACKYPAHAITIDGDLADWDIVDPALATCTQCYCQSCNSGDVVTLRGTHTDDGRVAILVEIADAPLAGRNDAYSLELSPLQGPGYAVAMRLYSSGAPDVSINGAGFSGWPIEVAYGARPSPNGAIGIEVAMPIAMLPFNGGFLADAVRVIRAFPTWNDAQQQAPTIATCWDPRSPVCQPR